MNRKILPSWRNCDERFFWNLNVVSDLIDTPGLDDRWITPVTNMWTSSEEVCFQTNDITKSSGSKNENFLLTLISRRNRRRQGPRSVLLYFPNLLILFAEES